jgi:hypothetical protein
LSISLGIIRTVAHQSATGGEFCEKAKLKWDEKGGKDGKGVCIAAAPAAPEAKK